MAGTEFSELSSEGEWFTYFESHINDKNEVVYDDPLPGAGRICVRDITPIIEERMKKRKRKYEFVLNPETRSMERVGYFEDITAEQIKKDSEDLWDYAITGIENFKIGNRTVECTREGKNELMKYPKFDRCVGKCLRMLNESTAKAKEAEAKN